VAPLLEKYDLPATFLLTTRWRRERGEYWWDLLERVMLSTPGVPPSFALDSGGLIETLPTFREVARLLYRVLPNLEIFNIRTAAVHGIATPGTEVHVSLASKSHAGQRTRRSAGVAAK